MKEKIKELPEIFKKIDSRKYDLSCCFLCGEDIDQNSRTLEHIIPRWLQHKFNLWNQKIILLNRTLFQYRYLRIPCCESCNGTYLKPIEDKIKLEFESGFEKFNRIERKTLFFWLGKIYYGIFYKEMSLLLDRSNSKKGFIASPEFMKEFTSHWMFLQGIRGKHEFQDFFPASIFIFQIQKPKEVELQWDFRDDPRSMFISIRMGEIGIVAVLQDGGTQESEKDLLSDFFKIPLHPLQFQEVSAIILYKSLLFNRTPKYVSIEQGDSVKTLQMPLAGYSFKPLFNDWDFAQYARILSSYTDIPRSIINPAQGKVLTYIKNKKGKINFMDIKKYPIY